MNHYFVKPVDAQAPEPLMSQLGLADATTMLTCSDNDKDLPPGKHHRALSRVSPSTYPSYGIYRCLEIGLLRLCSKYPFSLEAIPLL